MASYAKPASVLASIGIPILQAILWHPTKLANVSKNHIVCFVPYHLHDYLHHLYHLWHNVWFIMGVAKNVGTFFFIIQVMHDNEWGSSMVWGYLKIGLPQGLICSITRMIFRIPHDFLDPAPFLRRAGRGQWNGQLHISSMAGSEIHGWLIKSK